MIINNISVMLQFGHLEKTYSILCLMCIKIIPEAKILPKDESSKNSEIEIKTVPQVPSKVKHSYSAHPVPNVSPTDDNLAEMNNGTALDIIGSNEPKFMRKFRKRRISNDKTTAMLVPNFKDGKPKDNIVNGTGKDSIPTEINNVNIKNNDNESELINIDNTELKESNNSEFNTGMSSDNKTDIGSDTVPNSITSNGTFLKPGLSDTNHFPISQGIHDNGYPSDIDDVKLTTFAPNYSLSTNTAALVNHNSNTCTSNHLQVRSAKPSIASKDELTNEMLSMNAERSDTYANFSSNKRYFRPDLPPVIQNKSRTFSKTKTPTNNSQNNSKSTDNKHVKFNEIKNVVVRIKLNVQTTLSLQESYIDIQKLDKIDLVRQQTFDILDEQLGKMGLLPDIPEE